MMMTKTTVKTKRKFKKLLKAISIVGSYAALLCVIVSLNTENKELNKTIEDNLAQYNDTINEYNNTINEKDKKIEELNNTIQDLDVIINDLDVQLVEIARVNESYVDELTEFRKREELFNKYEYAVIDDGYRTDLTYEEIKLGEDLMVERGMDPHLMFGSIMAESNARPYLVNSSSGATGYGQFLDSSARWVWTVLMGNSGYYPELRKHGPSNIKMMASYYDYLYDTQGSTFKVVKYYSGNSTDEGAAEYLARVNKYTSKVGVTIK